MLPSFTTIHPLNPHSPVTLLPNPFHPQCATTPSHQKTTPPPSPSPSPPVQIIPNTPGFTPRLSTTPLPLRYRDHYITLLTNSLLRYLQTSNPTLCELTLLLPETNPALDVYSKNFILDILWGIVDVGVNDNRGVLICVQGKEEGGWRGGEGLATAGLREMVRRGVVLRGYGEGVRVGGFEEEVMVGDMVVVLCGGNIVGRIVVAEVGVLMEKVREVKGAVGVLVNCEGLRVKAGEGVREKGVVEKGRFLDSVDWVFFMRLLYLAGSLYPVRGILWKEFPGCFEVWKKREDEEGFVLLKRFGKERPEASEISEAFELDRLGDGGSQGLPMGFSLGALLALVVGTIVYVAMNGGEFAAIVNR